MKGFFVPTLLIILSIPMIFEMIPRNGFYGFRTPYTLSSDQVWYRANRISGLALLAAGLFWLALGIVLAIADASATSRSASHWVWADISRCCRCRFVLAHISESLKKERPCTNPCTRF